MVRHGIKTRGESEEEGEPGTTKDEQQTPSADEEHGRLNRGPHQGPLFDG